MKKLIQGVHEMLIDCVGTPLKIDVFYREADEENIKLPYLVYNSQSDSSLYKYREDFTFTVELWGVDDHYGLLDEATDRIKKCINDNVLHDCCSPLLVSSKFVSRMDVPVEDQRLRSKEVRFRVSYYE